MDEETISETFKSSEGISLSLEASNSLDMESSEITSLIPTISSSLI